MVYRVGKREIWRSGASVLLRIQERKKKKEEKKTCGVGALQEGYVCLHKAIPFMPVAAHKAEQRQTVS